MTQPYQPGTPWTATPGSTGSQPEISTNDAVEQLRAKYVGWLMGGMKSAPDGTPIDPDTGEPNPALDIVGGKLSSIEKNPAAAARYELIKGASGSPDKLVSIDPNTGKATDLGNFGGDPRLLQSELDLRNAQIASAKAQASGVETPEERAALAKQTQDAEMARTQSQEGAASARQASSEAAQTTRTQLQETGANTRNANSEAAATGRTILTGQNALAQIDAQRKADIDKATQKFGQDKDLESLKASLQQINEKALEDVKAQHATEQETQREDFERPFKQSTAEREKAAGAAETSRAATEAQRAKDEAQYRQDDLDRQQRTSAADMLTKQGQGMQQQLQEGAKSGTAPTAGAANAAFGPLAMAFQLMQAGVKQGWLDQSRIPQIPGMNAAPAPVAPSAPEPAMAGAPQPTGGEY